MKIRNIILLAVVVWSACSSHRIRINDQASRDIPPGQRATENFPILRIGDIPDLRRENWSLQVTGEVHNELEMKWNDFIRMDTVVIVSNFHCVTGWSRLENRWVGVKIRDVLSRAGLKKKAKFILFKAADGYSTNLRISECTGHDDILAFEWEGKPLDNTLGGPVRAVVPGKYGYKSAMWLTEIRITENEIKGYWEQGGYSNTANPWKEDRYHIP